MVRDGGWGGTPVDAHPLPHLPSPQLMAQVAEDLLFGRIALHYKLVTREQVLEATQIQATEEGRRRLGEILTEKGILTPRQVEQILAVQRDYVAKQQAQEPAPAAPAPPAAAPLQPQAMPALTVQAMPSLTVAEPPAASAGGIEFDLEVPRALDRLLKYALSVGASDLHLHSGAPLKIRVNGRMADLNGKPTAARTAEKLVEEILTPEQREALRERGQVDFAYTLTGQGRFRSNAYRQQRGIDAVFRVIPPKPPTLESLSLPSSLARLANYHQGMVLLTGPAGCGKSSTLAALLNLINDGRADGNGRVPALEILMANKAVGNLIRENKTFQIKSVLQTGATHGMCLLDASLAELVKNKVITRDEAARNAEDPQRFAGAAPAPS